MGHNANLRLAHGLAATVASLGMIGGWFTSPALRAQERADTEVSLGLPAATARALRNDEGITRDQLRRNGLILTVRGEGSLDLVLYVLTVRHGRIVGRWTSRSHVRARPGDTKLRGAEFLPEESFATGQPVRVVSEGPPVTAAAAMRAIDSAWASVFLDPRTGKDVSGMILFAELAMPAMDGSSKARTVGPLTRALLLRP